MALGFEDAKGLWLAGLDKLKTDLPPQHQPENPLHTYAFTTKYDGQVRGTPSHVVFLGYATQDSSDADAAKQNLYHQFVKREYWTPGDPVSKMLFNESNLIWYKEDLSFFQPVIERLTKSLLTEKGLRIDKDDFTKLFLPLHDILEKLGFIEEMYESLSTAPFGRSLPRMKSSFYFFVWSVKALHDSLAVFLKQWYSLPEERGAIDLGNGLRAKGTFLISLQKENKELADTIAENFQGWINEVTEYRNNTIHRFGVFFSVKDGAYKVPRDANLDPSRAAQMSLEEIDSHLESIVPFIQKWRSNSWALTRLTFTNVSRSL